MGWKKIITSLSNAVLNSLTTTGNVTVDGDLSADLPSNSVSNGLVVVQDPNTKKLFKTGSYGVGGGGENVNFNVGGNTGILTNLNIVDYAGDVVTTINNGTLNITFGTPTEHTVNTPTVSNFDTNRFNQQNDPGGYNVSLNNFNLAGNTFVSGQLQRTSPGGSSYETVHTFGENENSVAISTSFTGDTSTNLLQGGHKFRLRITAELANGEDLSKTGGTVQKTLNKTDPGNPSFSTSRTASPSIAKQSSYIEKGATGNVTYTYNAGSDNGWTSLGFNSSNNNSTGATISPSNINYNNYTATDSSLSTGNKYEWWSSGDLNSPTTGSFKQLSGFTGRMVSVRAFVSSDDAYNGDFGESELLGLTDSRWNTTNKNNGPIFYATNTENEIEAKTFSLDPYDQYIYFIYDEGHDNLNLIDNVTGGGNKDETGAYRTYNKGIYQIYQSLSKNYNTSGINMLFKLHFA